MWLLLLGIFAVTQAEILSTVKGLTKEVKGTIKGFINNVEEMKTAIIQPVRNAAENTENVLKSNVKKVFGFGKSVAKIFEKHTQKGWTFCFRYYLTRVCLETTLEDKIKFVEDMYDITQTMLDENQDKLKTMLEQMYAANKFGDIHVCHQPYMPPLYPELYSGACAIIPAQSSNLGLMATLLNDITFDSSDILDNAVHLHNELTKGKEDRSMQAQYYYGTDFWVAYEGFDNIVEFSIDDIQKFLGSTQHLGVGGRNLGKKKKKGISGIRKTVKQNAQNAKNYVEKKVEDVTEDVTSIVADIKEVGNWITEMSPPKFDSEKVNLSEFTNSLPFTSASRENCFGATTGYWFYRFCLGQEMEKEDLANAVKNLENFTKWFAKTTGEIFDILEFGDITIDGLVDTAKKIKNMQTKILKDVKSMKSKILEMFGDYHGSFFQTVCFGVGDAHSWSTLCGKRQNDDKTKTEVMIALFEEMINAVNNFPSPKQFVKNMFNILFTFNMESIWFDAKLGTFKSLNWVPGIQFKAGVDFDSDKITEDVGKLVNGLFGDGEDIEAKQTASMYV